MTVRQASGGGARFHLTVLHSSHEGGVLKVRLLVPLVLAVGLLVAACGSDAAVTTTTNTVATTAVEQTTTTVATATTTKVDSLFPVTVETDSGPVTITTLPERIVSLSPTATETLFAIGAGDQVVAVDEYSYYPLEAPVTDLSGFSPNVEAILSYSPDLLVISGSPDDLQASMEAVGIPVLLFGSAATLDDAYTQIKELGDATGRIGEAEAVVTEMKARIETATASITAADTQATYYHELDPTYYSVTSATFIGQIYGLLDLVSIADAADPDGYGFPQLAEEYIIDTNPDYVFLADAQCCGESADTVGSRPGWSSMNAVVAGRVIVVDADIASRWGPRIADFVEAVAEAVYTDSGT